MYAGLKVSKELYELSDWVVSDKQEDWWSGMDMQKLFPKYPLGYLLRKLPYCINPDGARNRHLHLRQNKQDTDAYYRDERKRSYLYFVHADTPEDAACKLAIELFKQDVLKKEENHGTNPKT